MHSPTNHNVIDYIKAALLYEDLSRFKREFNKSNGRWPTKTELIEREEATAQRIADEASRIYRTDAGRADFLRLSPLLGVAGVGMGTTYSHAHWFLFVLFAAIFLFLGVFWAVDSARR